MINSSVPIDISFSRLLKICVREETNSGEERQNKREKITNCPSKKSQTETAFTPAYYFIEAPAFAASALTSSASSMPTDK